MKLKITLGDLDQESCARLAAVFAALSQTTTASPTTTGTFTTTSAPAPEADSPEEKDVRATVSRKLKKEVAKSRPEASNDLETPSSAAAIEVVDAQEVSPATTGTEDATDATITKEDLQKKIREVSVTHREALKAELDRLGGAKNVSTLDPRYYAQFHQFMSGL